MKTSMVEKFTMIDIKLEALNNLKKAEKKFYNLKKNRTSKLSVQEAKNNGRYQKSEKNTHTSQGDY